MKYKAIMAVALLAMATIIMVPFSESDAVFYDIDGKDVIGVEDSENYTITYTNHDYDDYQDMSMSISYSAKLVDSRGNTVSSGVSPSSGDMDNGISETLTVKAPKDVGSYKLMVTYEVDVTYTDSEGETVEVPSEDLEKESVFDIKVVQPITLSVTLKNTSNIDLTGYGVYFYVDDKKIDGSYTTIDMAKDGTSTITYEWIADASNGAHSFSVQPADSGSLVKIEGLGEKQTFYIGDSDYTMWIVLLVVFVILLALIMLWVYRKPVKNYGKPKSRR